MIANAVFAALMLARVYALYPEKPLTPFRAWLLFLAPAAILGVFGLFNALSPLTLVYGLVVFGSSAAITVSMAKVWDQQRSPDGPTGTPEHPVNRRPDLALFILFVATCAIFKFGAFWFEGFWPESVVNRAPLERFRTGPDAPTALLSPLRLLAHPLLIGLLLCLNEANLLFRGIMDRLRINPLRHPTDNASFALGPTEEDRRSAYDRGRVIGMLERGLIFILCIQQAYTAIGFVLALKAAVRFKELGNRAFAEYVLIGTLLSTLLAVLIAVIILV